MILNLRFVNFSITSKVKDYPKTLPTLKGLTFLFHAHVAKAFIHLGGTYLPYIPSGGISLSSSGLMPTGDNNRSFLTC